MSIFVRRLYLVRLLWYYRRIANLDQPVLPVFSRISWASRRVLCSKLTKRDVTCHIPVPTFKEVQSQHFDVSR